jgi:hypothetical protein
MNEQQQQQQPVESTLSAAKAILFVIAGIFAIAFSAGLLMLVTPTLQQFAWLLGYVTIALIIITPCLLLGERVYKTFKAERRQDQQMNYIKPNANNAYAAVWLPDEKRFVQPVNGLLPTVVPEHYSPTISEHHHNDIAQLYKIMELAQRQAPDEQKLLNGPQFPAPRDFADVLRTGFLPSAKAIYIAESATRGDVTNGMYALCHVAMGGRTGGGKTNATRLLMGQLLYAGATVYLATPNFAQVKFNGRRLEDWRPIVAKLAEPPAREEMDIADMLFRFKELFERRKEQEERSPQRQSDIFLVLGELPGIMARMRKLVKTKRITYDPVEIIEILLRESRQYGIHIITEFQDALVQTIDLSSGARENIGTGIYSGGDLTTAKLLLNLAKGQSVDETGIGKLGASYVRIQEQAHEAARVPFFSNMALYMLLGTPPDPMPDDDIYDERQVPATYCRVVDGHYVNDGAPVEMERDEDAFVAGQEEAEIAAMRHAVEGSVTRQTGPLSARVAVTEVTSEERQDYPRMDTIQEVQFRAMYQIKPNIDECLKRIDGVSTRHRQHAREIVKRMERGS